MFIIRNRRDQSSIIHHPSSIIHHPSSIIRHPPHITAGVTKIRLTGGEPLVRKEFPEIASRIGALKSPSQSPTGRHLLNYGITTNGILLSRHLRDVIDSGINIVNVSLDTLKSDRFEKIARRNGLYRVVSALDDTLRALVATVKVNCVVMDGVNDDEIFDFVDMGRNRLIDIRFDG